jgi:DNA-directed RNA polymerase specialized sigma24 family protein
MCEELTDQEWIRLLKQNDQRAVDCLWEMLFRFGIASARYYRVDKDIGHDGAMAAYMRIQKRGVYQYHFGCPFLSYCRLIVTNEVRRELEKRNRLPKEVELDDYVEQSVGESDPPPRAEQVTVRERLQPCLERLTSRKRKVIEQRYFKRQAPE